MQRLIYHLQWELAYHAWKIRHRGFWYAVRHHLARFGHFIGDLSEFLAGMIHYFNVAEFIVAAAELSNPIGWLIGAVSAYVVWQYGMRPAIKDYCERFC